MGRVRLEDAHSDTLAWLFKPWEAHGLGAHFLREFVAATGQRLPSGRVRFVETRKKITRAGERIDIEVRGDGWVLAIENKLDHVETPGQTDGYAQHYEVSQLPNEITLGIFLTRDGSSANADTFFKPMSYRTLRLTLDNQKPNGTSEATQVLRWFSDHIRRNLEL